MESVNSSIIFKDWKIVNVVSVFKKGRKNDSSNCRLVSLTLTIRNLSEQILRERIVKYMEGNGKRDKTQHGFVRGES